MIRFLLCIATTAFLALLLPPLASAQQQRRNPCTNELAPDCRRLNSRFRRLDGVCNNLDSPFLGAAETQFRRILTPDYADGRSAPRQSRSGRRGGPLPNARSVSLAVFSDVDRPSPRLAHMAMIFGQFLAHDLTLGGQPEDVECETERFCQQSGECVGIPINPPGQRIVDPRFPGPEDIRCIRVVRNEPCNNQLPRQQVNILTSFIDASQVYGVSVEELNDLLQLRSLEPLGLLATVPQNITSLENLLPPADPEILCRSPDPENRQCFVAGDFRRNNENAALSAMHTIWAREHNRIALQLRALNPSWDGLRLFQEARRIVGAMMQQITFNEFLTVMLGPNNVERFGLNLLRGRQRFRGYDPSVDPSVPNAMATAALRFGHSTVRNQFSRFAAMASERRESIPVLEFFNPEFLFEIENDGIDGILRGLALDPAQNIDRFFSDSILNNVITEGGEVADLMAINIQRGREHGLPGYNAFREACGLSRARTFDGLNDTIDGNGRAALQRAYRSVDDIDLFVGGIFEGPSNGGGLGATFTCILGNGFSALRRGDRFWFETDQQRTRFSLGQLETLRNATLARVICDNTDGVTEIQPQVMLRTYATLPDGSINDPRTRCADLPTVNLNEWQ